MLLTEIWIILNGMNQDLNCFNYALVSYIPEWTLICKIICQVKTPGCFQHFIVHKNNIDIFKVNN